MPKSFLVICGLLMIVACNTNNTNSSNNSVTVNSDSTTIINDPKSNLHVQTKNFVEIDSSGILLFPLSMSESTSEDDGGSFSYKNVTNLGYWNIAFYNMHTKQQYLLSNNKMVIRTYNVKGEKHNSYNDASGIITRKGFIFYNITTNDYNKDKLLNDKDPEYLFVSDKTGKNLKQISPINCALYSWQFVESANKVVMAVRKDSNHNNSFDEEDEVATYEYDLNNSNSPVEVFSTEFKNSLKVLFDRDWKRLKQ